MTEIPDIAIRGIRQSIPSGYVIGRISPGTGDAQLIPHNQLAYKLVATGIVIGGDTNLTTTGPGITGGGRIASGLTLAVEWNAGTVTAIDTTELADNSGTLTLANRGTSTLMGNPTTAAAKPSDIVVGTGLTLSTTGTLSATPDTDFITAVDSVFNVNTGTLAMANTPASTLFGNSSTLSAEPHGMIVIGSGVSLSPAGTLTATGSGGTVTQVNTSGAGITASPSPVIGVGTLSVEWNAGTINALSSNLRTVSNTLDLATSISVSQATILNTPTASTDGANKSYVDSVAAALNPAVAVQAATTSASDTSGLTYSNGAGGIGATLTGSVSTSFAVDGFTFTALGQRVLVKNDTVSPSGARNGVYYVTQLQTSLLPPILTRALDYDQPSDINNTGAIPVVNGTVNALTSWLLTSTVNTVGTDPLTYSKFSLNPSTTFTNAGTGLVASGTTISLDPLDLSLAINSGTIGFDQTPVYFSSSFTLDTTYRGKWMVDNTTSGASDTIVTLTSLAAGTHLSLVIQNNSTAHAVRLRPATGVFINTGTGDYILPTFASSRISIDSTGTVYQVEPGLAFWQPGAGYVTNLLGLTVLPGGTTFNSGTLQPVVDGTTIKITSGTLTATGGTLPTRFSALVPFGGSTSAAAEASQGSVFLCNQTTTITALDFPLSSFVNTGTYIASVITLNGTTAPVIANAVVNSNSIVATSTVGAMPRFTFSSPPVCNAGTFYGFQISRIDGSGSTALPVITASASATYLPGFTTCNLARLEYAGGGTIAVGTTLTIANTTPLGMQLEGNY